jgi:hypothetical protein
VLHRPLTAALAVLALLLAGCSGNSSPGAGSAAPPAAVLDEVDLAKSIANLQELKSFSFELNLTLDLPKPVADASGDTTGAALLGALSNVVAKGSYVAPDKMQVTISLLGQDWQVVVIGEKAWVKVAGAWQQVDIGQLDLWPDPQALFGGVLPSDVLKVATTSREKVNGVEAVRYSFSKADIEALARDLGRGGLSFDKVDEVSLDLWLNADNIPVRVAMDLAAKTEDGQKVAMKLTVNVTHIDDPSAEVKPPA